MNPLRFARNGYSEVSQTTDDFVDSEVCSCSARITTEGVTYVLASAISSDRPLMSNLLDK